MRKTEHNMRTWREARDARDARIDAGRDLAKHKLVEADDAVALLEAIIRPGDRVCLEGDNQKQADFLAQCLAAVDVHRVHNLHKVQSGVADTAASNQTRS
jgi:malonate decarboxylase alpha subunit